MLTNKPGVAIAIYRHNGYSGVLKMHQPINASIAGGRRDFTVRYRYPCVVIHLFYRMCLPWFRIGFTHWKQFKLLRLKGCKCNVLASFSENVEARLNNNASY